MKRKAQEFTGLWLQNYNGTFYHMDDCRGRFYLCGCMRGFAIQDRLNIRPGYRQIEKVHKRNDIWRLDFEIEPNPFKTYPGYKV